jgi:hypothetical protein
MLTPVIAVFTLTPVELLDSVIPVVALAVAWAVPLDAKAEVNWVADEQLFDALGGAAGNIGDLVFSRKLFP